MLFSHIIIKFIGSFICLWLWLLSITVWTSNNHTPMNYNTTHYKHSLGGATMLIVYSILHCICTQYNGTMKLIIFAIVISLQVLSLSWESWLHNIIIFYSETFPKIILRILLSCCLKWGYGGGCLLAWGGYGIQYSLSLPQVI